MSSTDPIPVLIAAVTLDTLDVLADVASNADPILAPLVTVPPLAPLATGGAYVIPLTKPLMNDITAYPLPQPVLRQIRESWWEMGEQYLHDNPDKNEIEVHFHHWNEEMRWEFKVARVNGEIVRQTWLNSVLVG